jgi:hypothetical protein
VLLSAFLLTAVPTTKGLRANIDFIKCPVPLTENGYPKTVIKLKPS